MKIWCNIQLIIYIGLNDNTCKVETGMYKGCWLLVLDVSPPEIKIDLLTIPSNTWFLLVDRQMNVVFFLRIVDSYFKLLAGKKFCQGGPVHSKFLRVPKTIPSPHSTHFILKTNFHL